MAMNKTHLGAIMLGTGVFLGLTGAAIIASDKRDSCKSEVEEKTCCGDEECCCKHSDIPTMSTDTVE